MTLSEPIGEAGGLAIDGAKGDNSKPSGGPPGLSPYATGGGGVTFAQRVATVYMASILTGARRAEAHELPAQRVSFQTGPHHPVDDLLIEFSDGAHQVTLAVACRAKPNFVPSDDATVKLVGTLLEEVARFDNDSHFVAVAAAGRMAQWTHLATACAIARAHADADTFQASLSVDGRWSREVRDRWDHFVRMVRPSVGEAHPEAEVLRLAWRLLSRLHILSFALQAPDEADRTGIATLLDHVAANGADGVQLRDRLEAEASRYDSSGGVVDRNVLRRDCHGLLNSHATRSSQAWKVVAEHRDIAYATVRSGLGGESASDERLILEFTDRRAALTDLTRAVGTAASALVVSGESGTGKSALTLSVISDLETADPREVEFVVVNFRALPSTSMELRRAMGMSMEEVLAELSAGCRLLVIDAADAALERSATLLGDLAGAAAAAGVGIVAITSDTAADFVREQIATAYTTPVDSFLMEPLGDTDIAVVAERFPLLRALLSDLTESSLLRRLVVLDLLARTGSTLESSMGEWDCLQLIWSRIVRGDGRPGLGSAEARERTLLAAASATLHSHTNHPASERPNPDAVDALRRDHLLEKESTARLLSS